MAPERCDIYMVHLTGQQYGLHSGFSYIEISITFAMFGGFLLLTRITLDKAIIGDILPGK